MGRRTIIEGNFNARAKREIRGVTDTGKEEMEKRGRYLKNRKVNTESRLLMNFIEKKDG